MIFPEYLTVTKFKTPVLLQIKYWTVWCIDHLSASSYTQVTNFQLMYRMYRFYYATLYFCTELEREYYLSACCLTL